MEQQKHAEVATAITVKQAPEGGWEVVRIPLTGRRTARTFATKQEAVSDAHGQAVRLARPGASVDVLVYGRGGQIQQVRSYPSRTPRGFGSMAGTFTIGPKFDEPVYAG